MRSRAVVIMASVVVFVSLVAAGLAFKFRFDDTNQRRVQQARFNQQIAKVSKDNREAIRTVLCFARFEVAASKTATPEQKKTAYLFYDRALELINAKPC